MRLRHQVALSAARLLYRGVHSEYLPAKREAARRQGTRALPANHQVHDLLLAVGRRVEGEAHGQRLDELRRLALGWMERLEPFEPRLVGSVWSGRIRPGSDIDLHVHHPDPEAIGGWPDGARLDCVGGEFYHWRFHDQVDFEVTVYASLDRDWWCDFSQAPMDRAGIEAVRASLLPAAPMQVEVPGLEGLEGALARHFGPRARARLV
ncbi:MAG: hypothetical protein KC910_30640, partial [Candidatus Eremiobacteraeota bacterium]|nr:hypothetical protein [Candidatus Eremiobacteraeota bacterium]